MERKAMIQQEGLFKQAKEKAGKQPKVMITDGSGSYHKAHMKEFCILI